jgi:dienelactone hydrolase/acyl carrier protein
MRTMTQAAQPVPAAVGGTAYNDHPVFFPAGDDDLFGILTSPCVEGNGTAVTMLTGGGYVTSMHRNRTYVRLSRRLAELGYHGLRFDYHGTGESGGTADRFELHRPFVGDLEAALAWLRGQGIDRHVLVGSCFGSRTALACAPGLAGLAGVVLLSPPARDLRYVEREGAAQVEALDDMVISQSFAHPLEQVLARGIPVLLVYGAQGMVAEDFERPELKAIVERAGSLVDVRVLEGPVHQFASVRVQDEVIDLITEWLCAYPVEVEIEARVRRFLVNELRCDRLVKDLTDDYPLIAAQVIDSTAILEIVGFLERELDVHVLDEELLPEHFGTIAGIARLVRLKQGPQPTEAEPR